MRVFNVGGSVVILRFLPDGRRLVAGVVTDPNPGQPLTSARVDQFTVRFVVLPLDGGDPVALDLPPLRLTSWWYDAHYGNAVAVHPDGERCWVAWDDELYLLRTTDGARRQGVAGVPAHQVALSPDGERLLATTAGRGVEQKWLTAIRVDSAGERLIGQKAMPELFRHLVGFLPDGRRTVTVENVRPLSGSPQQMCWVRIRSANAGNVLATVQNPTWHATQPAVSPDGHTLGVIGYSSLYLYDLPDLGKPRAIKGSSNYGDFRSFAFHPDGRTLAVIHGGPTLVKLYDLESMKPTRKYNWKLGPLNAVAFSPDGALGAAGSEDGRIVVWDVE